MTSEYIKQFNEIFSTLLIQVSPLVGSTYYNNFTTLIKYNSVMPIEQFAINVLPVKEMILTKNDSFFLAKDFVKSYDGEFLIQSSKEQAMQELLKLKDIYSQLDTESKKNMWDFFQALLCISEDYVKAKYMK